MPYKAPYSGQPEKMKRWRRAYDRTRRHGANWRQIINDQDGLCAICRERMIAHFHEPFGEDHNGNGNMQQRIGLCVSCHKWQDEEHMGLLTNWPGNSSMHVVDVLAEQRECGSYVKWCEKYGVAPKVGGIFSQFVWPNGNGGTQLEMLDVMVVECRANPESREGSTSQ